MKTLNFLIGEQGSLWANYTPKCFNFGTGRLFLAIATMLLLWYPRNLQACEGTTADLSAYPLSFQVTEDPTLDLVEVSIALGAAENPVSNALLLEMDIDLGVTLSEEAVVSLELEDSWMGESSGLNSSITLDANLQVVHIELERQDCESRSGYGHVAVIKITQSDVAPEAESVSGSNGIVLIENIFKTSFAESNLPGNGDGPKVYPSHFDDHLTIGGMDGEIEAVHLYSASGEMVYAHENVHGSVREIRVFPGQLRRGTYLVRVKMRTGTVSWRRIVKI